MRSEAVGVYSQTLWTPAKLPGLCLWLKADAGLTLNTGYVSAWADQSGKGHNFTQATASKQPLYEATGFNGKPCVTFDGVNDVLQNYRITEMDNAPGMVLAVLLQLTTQFDQFQASQIGPGSTHYNMIILQRAGNDGFVLDGSWEGGARWRFAQAGGGGWGYAAASLGMSADPEVIVGRFYKSANYVRRNGLPAAVGTTTPGTVVYPNTYECDIGSAYQSNTWSYAAVKIREMIITNTDLSTSDDLGTLETYLRTRRDP